MTQFNPTYRRVLALLQQDARMPVVALATELGLSRVTVSARIERLRRDRAIRRFTAELGAPDAKLGGHSYADRASGPANARRRGAAAADAAGG